MKKSNKKRFRKFPKDKYEELIKKGYKYIWNSTRDFLIVDTINKEFIDGEHGTAPFDYLNILNSKLNHMSLIEIRDMEILFK